jgi:hypothetical protein
MFSLRESASSSFLTDAKFPEGRKLLALYPVLLFYLSLSWMVLIGFQQGAGGRALPGVPPGAISAPANLPATLPAVPEVPGINGTRLFM